MSSEKPVAPISKTVALISESHICHQLQSPWALPPIALARSTTTKWPRARLAPRQRRVDAAPRRRRSLSLAVDLVLGFAVRSEKAIPGLHLPTPQPAIVLTSGTGASWSSTRAHSSRWSHLAVAAPTRRWPLSPALDLVLPLSWEDPYNAILLAPHFIQSDVNEKCPTTPYGIDRA